MRPESNIYTVPLSEKHLDLFMSPHKGYYKLEEALRDESEEKANAMIVTQRLSSTAAEIFMRKNFRLKETPLNLCGFVSKRIDLN